MQLLYIYSLPQISKTISKNIIYNGIVSQSVTFAESTEYLLSAYLKVANY